jgi:membrane-associated progesterone receptor component
LKLDFYGYGKPYGVFAGKDATRAVAKWSKNESDMTSDLVSFIQLTLFILNKNN